MGSEASRVPTFVGELDAGRICDELREGCGFATFRCGCPERLIEVASTMGAVRLHRHGYGESYTRIIADERADQRYLGLTHGYLPMHTDCPAMPQPPRVVLLWCRTPAGNGGESMVVSGQDVVDRIRTRDKGALKTLSCDDAAIFRTAENQHIGPIFRVFDGRLQEVRLRFDSFVYFSLGVVEVLPTLTAALEAVTQRFHLDAGFGYALRNDLWLHGRLPYEGRREMIRIHVDL